MRRPRWRRRPRRAGPDRPIRVLLDVPEARWAKNPYVYSLVRRPEPDVQYLGFTRRRALLGSYDVVHSHWPEHRVRSRRHGHGVRDRVWWILWVLRLHVQRIPVVRTRHNRGPHDDVPRADRLLIRLLETRTRAEIWLTELSRAETGRPPGPTDVVIPHPDYAPWIRRSDVVPGTARSTHAPHPLLAVGYVRRYKNFEEGIAAVAGCEEFSLLVAGPVSDRDYADELDRLADPAAGVEIALGRLGNTDLMHRVLDSHAVLLPYEDLYNSGVVFLAMGLGRPVILRDNPMARALRDEYGAAWIGTYEGPLTPDGLRSAWAQVAGAEGIPVGSRARGWRPAARAHARIYRRLARRT